SLILPAASKRSLSIPVLILWIAPMTLLSEQTIKRVVVGKGVTPGRQSFEGLALHCSQLRWGSQTKSQILDKFFKHLWKLWLQSTCDTIRGKFQSGARRRIKQRSIFVPKRRKENKGGKKFRIAFIARGYDVDKRAGESTLVQIAVLFVNRG